MHFLILCLVVLLLAIPGSILVLYGNRKKKKLKEPAPLNPYYPYVPRTYIHATESDKPGTYKISTPPGTKPKYNFHDGDTGYKATVYKDDSNQDMIDLFAVAAATSAFVDSAPSPTPDSAPEPFDGGGGEVGGCGASGDF